MILCVPIYKTSPHTLHLMILSVPIYKTSPHTLHLMILSVPIYKTSPHTLHLMILSVPIYKSSPLTLHLMILCGPIYKTSPHRQSWEGFHNIKRLHPARKSFGFHGPCLIIRTCWPQLWPSRPVARLMVGCRVATRAARHACADPGNSMQWEGCHLLLGVMETMRFWREFLGLFYNLLCLTPGVTGSYIVFLVGK